MNYDLSLEGKVAIVTGGAMGLGQGIVEAFAGLGAQVIVADFNAHAGQAAVNDILAAGGQAEFYELDVTNLESFQQMATYIVKKYGRIDLLVNNAGTAIKKDCIDMEVEEYRRIIDINLTGVWIGCKAVAPHMIAQKAGKIINMCSVFGFVALPGLSAYTSSKGGVNQLTKTLALELVGHNVYVNGIAPAYIATEMTQNARTDNARFEDILRRTALGRLGYVEEVAGAVVFLASDLSNFIVGQTILVDGGWTAM